MNIDIYSETEIRDLEEYGLNLQRQESAPIQLW